MLNWSHGAESLTEEGLKGNGRGEIEESQYRQLLGGVSQQRGAEKWNSNWQGEESQMYERNNSTWRNDGNDPLGEETDDTRERNRAE